ncbi:MAG: hypothetical protein AAFX95_07935 [Cyanobacteria bacterium J06639_16]
MKRDRAVSLHPWLKSMGVSLMGGVLAIATGAAAIAANTSSSSALAGAIEPIQLADVNIYFPFPTIPEEPRRQVVVEFVGLGTEWAMIYLNDQRVASMGTHDRRQRLLLTEGAYRLQITGVTRFDTWATGYLDVGRSDANVIVVTFSPQQGVVGVGGDPLAWIPDGRIR